jgi:hypothetical protein
MKPAAPTTRIFTRGLLRDKWRHCRIKDLRLRKVGRRYRRARLRRRETTCAGYLRGGFSIVKASGRIPFSTWRQLTGAAIGTPGRARGDHVPMAVVPRPFRR